MSIRHKRRSGRIVSAVDKRVGANIRALRDSAGLTQSDLAGRVGVTFQQLQKYERGTNRVAAGRLCLLARALDVPLLRLFDGVELGAGAE